MSLEIRAYNVLFGDAILISWDEDDGLHHAWVDFGNFSNDPNEAFQAVYDDVRARTSGVLDLVVITHRHLDHLEGFSSLRDQFAAKFHIERLWHAHVTPDLDHVFELTSQAVARLLPEGAADGPGDVGALYRNNDAISTGQRMDGILATLPVAAGGVHAIHRQLDLAAGPLPQGMARMAIEVLAPEEDSGVYLAPLQEALAPGEAIGAALEPYRATDEEDASPFAGLADFERLRRRIRTGGLRILAAADKTRNNTSIVMRWTYDDAVRILLTGDAEETSWAVMQANGADLTADALKVGHHGSINASPAWSFDRVFPTVAGSNLAVVCTDPKRFTGTNEVPKAEVVAGWTARLSDPARFLRTDSVPVGTSVSVRFET